MSGVFRIPLANGLRWTPEQIDIDPRYNTLPFDSLIDEQSYAQPWQTLDNPPIHLLSDFIDITCDFFTCNNVHQANFAVAALVNSLQQQTFLPYKAICDFTGFAPGQYYGRIGYDGNLPSSYSVTLNKLLSPLIDGNLRVKDNGGLIRTLLFNETVTGQIIAGHTYSYEAYSTVTSTAANPRIRLTVTKDGVVIFDQSAVQTNTSSIIYTGIAQPGSIYTAKVTTEDTSAVVTPINIADATAVPVNRKSWRSCPIDVQDSHPETMLYQYTNSYNKNDIIFTGGTGREILLLRVEANIRNFQPKSQKQSFNDQEYDGTLLSGITYRTHINWVGGTGIPDWVIDKLNLIFSFDSVKIDTTYYEVTEDFKGEREQYQLNQDGRWQLPVQEIPGDPGESYQPGVDPTGDLIVIRKVWPPAPFPNFSASFFITGIFNQYSNLDTLVVYNYGLNTFIMKIGTSAGENDIAELEIGTPNADTSIDLISNHDIGQGFNVPTTIFVTMPNSIDIKALFVYDQLDNPALNSPAPTSGGMVQGQVSMYKELVNGYFTRDWDIATGLGKVGSLYEGCQILDEYAGKVAIGWDRTKVDPAEARGSEVGNPGNEVQITRSELPAEGLRMFADQINSTNDDFPGDNDYVVVHSDASTSRYDYKMLKATIPPTGGRTEHMGGGSSVYIGNDALITVFFVKL